MIELPLIGAGPGRSEPSLILPPSLTGRWCELRFANLPTIPCRLALMFREEAEDDLPGSPIVLAPRPDGTAAALVYLPREAGRLRVELLGAELPPAMRVRGKPIPRGLAGVRLLARDPGRVARAALGSPAGLLRRLRAALVRNVGYSGADSYDFWLRFFDVWPAEPGLFLAPAAASACEVLIFCAGGADTAPARATIDSLRAQVRQTRFRVVHPARAGQELRTTDASYVGVLQAGEVLPPHATALIGAWMARHGTPPALYTDLDHRLGERGRDRPEFRPEPNRALMLSGTLTRGLWLFRRDSWERHFSAEAAEWAETLRLDLWLRMHEQGEAGATRRIPFLLTSRRPDAEAAPPAALAVVAETHFRRIGTGVRITGGPGHSIRVSPLLPDAQQRPVTLVIPSALRAAHVRRCVRAVLDRTEQRALDIALVVSQAAPLDPAQRQTLDALADPRLRLVQVPVERFNYARANNEAVRQSAAEFVCLLNDDVAPKRLDWLGAMLGHFADPEVAAVGARLLYPNGLVQHAGIVIGLGGLADHAHRFLRADDPGYCGRAVLNQEVSAVTGACLLVRRDVYMQVGGMDESYPVAFNDVDFCLKLGEAGHRIVYCADAELTHYESLSLGHHFSGERAGLERVEVRRMRARWPAAIAADPFHSPNLSLLRGQEWEPAFPPRVRRSDYLQPAEASLRRGEPRDQIGQVPDLS